MLNRDRVLRTLSTCSLSLVPPSSLPHSPGHLSMLQVKDKDRTANMDNQQEDSLPGGQLIVTEVANESEEVSH